MGLMGPAVKDINVRLRIYIFIFACIIALASLLQWRASMFLASEYVDIPVRTFEEKYSKQIN